MESPTLIRSFFRDVIAFFEPKRTEGARRPVCFVTTHILRDRPYFLEAVARIAEIVSLTPKPKSIDRNTLAWLKNQYPVHHFSREDLANPEPLLAVIGEQDQTRPFVLSDIGGYYCPVVSQLFELFPDRFLGVIEDTENGFQRYSRLTNIAFPVISVARSSLKNPEDFLIGQSIVYSAEALLRERGDILQGRGATVIGYGKLGRSIASTLRERHVETTVFDTNPITTIEALSHGFHIAQDKKEALSKAGLVFCATGNIALRGCDFSRLPDGCYIATATSSDDELQTGDIKERFRRRRETDFVVRYSAKTKSFYLLNHGQAVNFLHGAVVGPFIYLIQGEVLAAMCLLQSSSIQPGLSETPVHVRRRIAQFWLKHFQPSAVSHTENHGDC